MQVEQFLENSARQWPDKVALVHGSERLTYRQIEDGANELAHALIAAGVERGDRVVTFLPNSVEAVLAIFATLKAGAAFVVLNPTTKPDKLTYILNNCRASAMITWGGRLFSDPTGWIETPHLHSVFVLGANEAQAAAVQSAGKKLIRLEEVRQGTKDAQSPAKKCIDIDLAAL